MKEEWLLSSPSLKTLINLIVDFEDGNARNEHEIAVMTDATNRAIGIAGNRDKFYRQLNLERARRKWK